MVHTRPAGAHDKGQAPLLIDENAPAEGGQTPSRKDCNHVQKRSCACAASSDAEPLLGIEC